jgi:hypothetical protein
MRESASTDLREPQGSNPLGPPGPFPRAAEVTKRILPWLCFSSSCRHAWFSPGG